MASIEASISFYHIGFHMKKALSTYLVHVLYQVDRAESHTLSTIELFLG
jgi:hypothetical protein